jgi:hypothetical protein
VNKHGRIEANIKKENSNPVRFDVLWKFASKADQSPLNFSNESCIGSIGPTAESKT